MFILFIEYADVTRIGESISIRLTISNHTNSNQQAQYDVSESSDFLLTGKRSGLISILPLSLQEILINAIPISSGYTQMPDIKIYSQQFNQWWIPSHSKRQVLILSQNLVQI
jgi:hypothetical protein